MAGLIICPTCSTTIDPEARCSAEVGMGRCMENQGHGGWHWTDLGHRDGSVLIWTGLFHKRSCPGRISLSRWCQRPIGHEGPHNDGHGVTFVLAISEED